MNSIKVLSLTLLISIALSACDHSNSSAPEPTTPESNTAPVAVAGTDQHVKTNEEITLNGAKSLDADHDALDYIWTITATPDGYGGLLIEDESPHPTFIPSVEGAYVFKLIVSDGNGESAASTVTVTATHAHNNAKPVADAGVDQHVKTNVPVTLDGSKSSDADGDVLTFSWTWTWTMTSTPVGSGAALLAENSSHPTFTADLEGDYTFKLIVNDGTIDSAESTVTVTATPVHINARPVAIASANTLHTKTGSLVKFDGSNSYDKDRELLTFHWYLSSSPNGSSANLLDASSSHPTFTPDIEGSYVFKLTISDGVLESEEVSITVTATRTNDAPVVNAGADKHVNVGDDVTLHGSMFDADGDNLIFNWGYAVVPIGSILPPGNIQRSNTSLDLTFAPDVEGVYVITLIVNDGKFNSVDSVTVTATHVNVRPVAHAGGDDLSHKVGEIVQLDGSGSSDANSDPLTYLWYFSSIPPNSKALLSDVTSPRPTFTPDLEGNYIVKLVVNDGTIDSTEDDTTVTATPVHINAVPVAVISVDSTHYKVGDIITLDGSGSTDADGDQLKYVWVVANKPAGSEESLTNSDTAVATFHFDVDGIYSFILSVSDGVDKKIALINVTVTPAPINARPVAVASVDSLHHKVGSLVTLDASGSSDADSDPLTYLWHRFYSPLDSKAELSDVTSPRPTFTPDLAGEYILKLVVNDGTIDSEESGTTVSATGHLTNAQPVAVVSIDSAHYKVGDDITLDGSGSTDADGDLLDYRWLVANKPAGSEESLTNSDTAVATFHFDVDGIYSFILSVSDGVNERKGTHINVTVTPAPVNARPVAVASVDSLHHKVGSLVTLDASGSSDADSGDTLTYQWHRSGSPLGSLTAGLSSKTAISPTFTPDVEGLYIFKLTVNDGSIDSEESTVGVTVTAADINAKPVVRVSDESNTTTTVTLDASGSTDADGDALVYTWEVFYCSGATITKHDSIGERVTVTCTQGQPTQVYVKAWDGKEWSDTVILYYLFPLSVN